MKKIIAILLMAAFIPMGVMQCGDGGTKPEDKKVDEMKKEEPMKVDNSAKIAALTKKIKKTTRKCKKLKKAKKIKQYKKCKKKVKKLKKELKELQTPKM